jgi:hypothetical protein
MAKSKSSIEKMRNSIVAEIERLQNELATLDRLVERYAGSDNPNAAKPIPRNQKAINKPAPPRPDPPTPIQGQTYFELTPGSLVDAVRHAIQARPQQHFWMVRQVYDAVKEDGFQFARDEEGSVSAVSNILSKLSKKGVLTLHRKKAGRVPAVYVAGLEMGKTHAAEVELIAN